MDCCSPSGEQYTGDFGGNMMDLSITLNGADSLVSECEWTMSRDILYRPPISSTAFLGILNGNGSVRKLNGACNGGKTSGQGEWINSWDMLGDDPNIWKRDVKDADVHCKSRSRHRVRIQMERRTSIFPKWPERWHMGSSERKCFAPGTMLSQLQKVKGSVTEENLNVIVDVTAPEITSFLCIIRLLTIDYSEPVHVHS
ncbi:unnamed protein product [Bathycoccus prasinos]